jgi:nicotinate phosphoribosyltransferase
MYFDKNTIKKIRKGYYSALYFNRTRIILEKEKNYKTVTMQVFQKNEATLCGVDEILELFKIGTGYFHNNKWINKYKTLSIEHLNDGDQIAPYEPVMHITGPYVYFAHLESLYLGILARRTLVATNSHKVMLAAHGKKVIFFADRFDHFSNQEGDGYAAHIGGIETVCTKAQAARWNGKIAGTIPHALIAINDGDTIEATLQFARNIKGPVIALVDFDNDCVGTSLKVAAVLKNKLWGVRVDTSETLVDTSLKDLNLKGVNPTLIKLLRKSLDGNGFSDVKIVASGGFNEEKINLFENKKTPVDVYGVGSSLLKGANDFTADIVMVEGKKNAKYGREYHEIKSHSF